MFLAYESVLQKLKLTLLTLTITAVEAQPLLISSNPIAYAKLSNPVPPKLSGTSTAIIPSSPSFLIWNKFKLL